MMTFVSPDAAGVLLDAGAELELVVALDELDDVVELEDVLVDLLPLEHPATPTTIVATPAATNNSRFTNASSGWFRPARYRRILSSSMSGRTPIGLVNRR
jgi:hypothetical protein